MQLVKIKLEIIISVLCLFCYSNKALSSSVQIDSIGQCKDNHFMNFIEFYNDNIQLTYSSDSILRYSIYIKANCAVEIEKIDEFILEKELNLLSLNFSLTKSNEEAMCQCVNVIYLSSKVKLSDFEVKVNGKTITGNKYGLDYHYTQIKDEFQIMHIDKIVYTQGRLIVFEEYFDSNGKLISINEYHQFFGLLKKRITLIDDNILIDINLF